MKWASTLGAKAPPQSLKYLLHKHLTGWGAGRTLANIHASELTKPEGLCPRLYALTDILKIKPKDEYLTTSMEVTYHMGRVLQDSAAGWFADMGIAVGDWECITCKQLHEFQTRPGGCIKCGSPAMKYKEIRFKSEECGASCGVDIFVNLGGTKLRGVEFKTMDKDEFKSLQAPLAEHRLRSNFYCRIMADADTSKKNLIETDKLTVLYISKGGYGVADPQLKVWGLNEGFSPFKEFVVNRDDSQTEYLWKRSKIVADYRRGLVGMPAGICTTAMAKRAAYCMCKGPCFSGEHPAEYEWQT